MTQDVLLTQAGQCKNKKKYRKKKEIIIGKTKKKLNRVRFDFVHSLKYPFKKM